MKILLATYWLLPHLGGVWPYMNQIKQKLEAMGHSVDLMGHTPDFSGFHIVNENRALAKDLLTPLLYTKIDAASYPTLNADRWVYETENARYCMELAAAYLGLDQYDLIHTQDVISTRALSRVKPKKTPLIANIHGSIAREVMLAVYHQNANSELRQLPIWNYYKTMEYFGATSADVTLTSTYWMKNLMVQEYGVPAHKINVFQYGLDMNEFWRIYQAGTPVQKPLGKKVIICPARLVFIKGIEVLLSALGKLKHARNDWVCWIVGDGELLPSLQQQAANQGLHEQVQFLGYREDVPALLGLSDIFVLPSLQDNQPFSVMEAQMIGLPSVVSDAGGLPEMVEHGKTGLVFPVGDTDALAHYLHLLLQEDGYRIQLGTNAKDWGTSHWSLDQMMTRLLGFYNRAMEKVSGRYGAF
ncbi:glycosyltransferase family 4 protein [Paenibacillus sp. Soil787]|uniref:glycosyltransferase family 4 protein n=1 Tax=Paenibacillus sp. Soil787 TaxID=1736411 RepID=UPI00070310B7|nr:glycosyltransferase family 4 protein [Paenibacillus sp. Soil787]KRF18690.1 glycosyl transferase [Paenibacillus sp. Soil787]